MDEIVNSSLILTIIGVTIYWCGMLYNRASPLKKNKENYYYSGVFFLAMKVAIPLMICLLFNPIVSLLLELEYYDSVKSIINIIYGLVLIGIFRSLGEDLRRVMNTDSEAIIKFKQNQSDKDRGKKDKILFIYSFAIIFLSYCMSRFYFNKMQEHMEYSVSFLTIILLVVIVSISGIAIIAGWNYSYFPTVAIWTKHSSPKDSLPIIGTIWKHNDYVYVNVNGKNIEINNDCIYCIEVDYKDPTKEN